jgi:polysaccharide pyruvyl transferase WcaK-like protein
VGRRWVKDANLCLVGGTNLLTSHYTKYRQWKLTPFDAHVLRGKVVLMGVGWWQYQDQPDAVTSLLYRTILSQKEGVLHAVRDGYTLRMLNSIGITNVVNTCCPTMWGLEENHCRKIPAKRADTVVTTLTDYHMNVELDRVLLHELDRRYRRVIAWPQGLGDRDYMKELGVPTVAEPGLWSLDRVLSNPSVDYVGTRLHAGIRALQHGRRAIIVSVDNRATEIAKDTGLTVVERQNVQALCHALDQEKKVEISLPHEGIQAWKTSIVRAVTGRLGASDTR